MEFSSINLSIIITLCMLFSESAKTLQIFGGTITEISCSADSPFFRLVREEIEYESYNQLPDLFDIEARASGNVVTLYINGTNRSNNMTVICRTVDVSSSQIEIKTLFTLMLEFISTLPAPNNVHSIEDPAGHLQILWEPPTLVSDEFDSQNVSIDSRITQFIIYIITSVSTTVYNASGTNYTIEVNKFPCSFWFQVAAVNPAGAGERSPPQNLTFDSHTGCLDSTSSTTVIEPISESSGLLDPRFVSVTPTQVPLASTVREIFDLDKTLLDWAISSTTIAVLLAVVCISLAAACLFMWLKMYHNGDLKNTEREIEMKQNEVYGISSRPL